MITDEDKLIKEMMEYASIEKINEEKGGGHQHSHQAQPFPIETVDLRYGGDRVGRPSFRSQTVHEFATGNCEQLVSFNPIDLKGVAKLTYDGCTKKLNKSQFLRIHNDHMLLVTEKGGEEIIIDNLCLTDYKPISKKEVSIKKTSEDVCKIYKLQFDNVKEMNCAIVDLETYYGVERPILAKLQSPEEKSQIRYKLLKLLGKRSSKDLLEKKGIIKNEPIFGNTLRHLYETYKQEVPEFVLKIIKLIELPKNIESVGLYRASGNLATIQKIRFNIDKNNLKILDEFKNDSDVLTGSLKLFFRELKEPLIPHKLYENLFKFIDLDLTPKIGDSVKQLTSKMDKAHKTTLLTLLDHLLKVEAHSEENRMDAYNISIVWGPTLIWPPDNCHDNILLSHTNANKVVELLLNVYKISSSPLLKHEPSSPLTSNEEGEEGAVRDKNALMLALNENLTKASSKDNLVKSTDSLTRHRSPLEKDIKFDLEALSATTKEKVPEFVLKTIPLIERGINMEHLYKKPGNYDKLEKIRKKISKKGSNLNSMEKYNPHDLASALKNFFVDLKEAIIPKAVFNRLVLATDERIEITKLRNTKRELTMAEIPQRETLDYVLRHLVNVSRHEESNKMSKHNLAVEWGPILARPFVENHEVSVGCSIQVLETLLQIYDSKTAINLDSEWNQNVDVRLGRSPEYTSNQVLPPIAAVAKRRPKVIKNDSSLYRVSKFISNTLSLYDNVQYTGETRDEANILDDVQVKKSAKGPEDRTKL
uniref:Rho-GAP domain-containing protein n=1 Tax=Photinus pyralis TaxID=7054 RepID=A0A1Y1NBQ2_PHOPY